jgi:hypothetical protein
MFPSPVTDRDLFARAAKGAGELVATAVRALRLSGYQVDDKALLDTARFLYTPRALVDDDQRNAELLVLREEPYDPAGLAPPPARPRLAPALTFTDASRRYNKPSTRASGRGTAARARCAGTTSASAGCRRTRPGGPASPARTKRPG